MTRTPGIEIVLDVRDIPKYVPGKKCADTILSDSAGNTWRVSRDAESRIVLTLTAARPIEITMPPPVPKETAGEAQ